MTTESPAELEGIAFLEESYIVGVGRTVDIPFVLQPENAVSNVSIGIAVTASADAIASKILPDTIIIADTSEYPTIPLTKSNAVK